MLGRLGRMGCTSKKRWLGRTGGKLGELGPMFFLQHSDIQKLYGSEIVRMKHDAIMLDFGNMGLFSRRGTW